MEIFVNNTFGNYLIQFYNYFITAMSGLWKIISYEFFTLPLEWLNEIFNFEYGSSIYFYDLPISILTIGTSGILVFLMIHFLVLIRDFIFGD